MKIIKNHQTIQHYLNSNSDENIDYFQHHLLNLTDTKKFLNVDGNDWGFVHVRDQNFAMMLDSENVNDVTLFLEDNIPSKLKNTVFEPIDRCRTIALTWKEIHNHSDEYIIGSSLHVKGIQDLLRKNSETSQYPLLAHSLTSIGMSDDSAYYEMIALIQKLTVLI